MRKLAFVTTAVVVAACSGADSRAAETPSAQTAGVQLPNVAIFGRPTSEPIQLLREKEQGDAEPLVVWTDIRCGRYSGMTAHYRPEVSEAAVKTAISKLYGDQKLGANGKPVGWWRIESQQFSIMVGMEREGFNKGTVHAIFNRFLGPDADPCSAFADEPAKGSERN
jgi:hypothetical protein